MEKIPIYLFGYPRSGNVWLARLLGDALNSPVMADPEKKLTPSVGDEGLDRDGAFIIHQHHAWRPLRNDVPIIYLYRDPRDVAVSIMYYWGFNSLDEVFTHDGKAPKILHPRLGWASMMQSWNSADKYRNYINVLTNYERLTKWIEREFRRIVETIVPPEYIPSDERIYNAIKNQEFSTRRIEIEKAETNTYPYGQTIQLKHMRKGIIGDWKSHFKRQHAEIAHENWWHWLHVLGYEKDEDWWEKVEE